jgi:hypothetical protein
MEKKMRRNMLKTLFVCAFLVSSFTVNAGGKPNVNQCSNKRVREKANHHFDLPAQVIDDLKRMAEGNLNQEELEEIKTSLVLYNLEHFPCSSMKKWISSREGLTIIEKEMSTFVETYHHLDFDNVAHQYDRTKAHMRTACHQLINSR